MSRTKKFKRLTRLALARPQLSVMALVAVALLTASVGIFFTRLSRAAASPDLNNDGVVSVLDLSIMLGHWGMAGVSGDLDGDGNVGVTDLSVLLNKWGMTVTPTPTPTPADSQAPTAPPNVHTTAVSQSQVTFAWDASTDTGGSGLAGYRVYQLAGATPALQAEITAAQSRTFSKSSLTAGTAYTFQVRAFDGAGNLSAISTLNVTTTVPPSSAVPCASAGAAPAPPATYAHVVWIWMENKSYSNVFGSTVSGNAYQKSLRDACGYSTNFKDNVFGSTDLVSRPHYLAGISGSNCNSGLTGSSASSSGCQTSNSDASVSGTKLTTVSLFEQVKVAGKTWRSYQESAPTNCSLSTSGSYAAKHDPAIYYTRISSSDCASFDLKIAGISCTSSSCGTPSANALINDINNGTLPAFASITPNLCNDEHDCSVATGDQWLKTYVKRILDGPNYRSGDTAVFVIWDEAAGPGESQPVMFVTPYTPPTASTATMNLFSVLRATEQMLGLTNIGCATGTIPGSSVACPSGSTANLRSIFHF